jgi:hypothetical protein
MVTQSQEAATYSVASICCAPLARSHLSCAHRHCFRQNWSIQSLSAAMTMTFVIRMFGSRRLSHPVTHLLLVALISSTISTAMDPTSLLSVAQQSSLLMVSALHLTLAPTKICVNICLVSNFILRITCMCTGYRCLNLHVVLGSLTS